MIISANQGNKQAKQKWKDIKLEINKWRKEERKLKEKREGKLEEIKYIRTIVDYIFCCNFFQRTNNNHCLCPSSAAIVENHRLSSL